MKKIHIDFETRSEADIKAGAWVYSLHPSTEILCLAYAIDDQPVQIFRKEDISRAGDFFQKSIEEGAIFIAHYAGFEQHMWDNIMVKQFGAIPIPVKQWRCTAAMAAVMALPRHLGGVGEALNLNITKDMDGKAVMMKMCKPRKPLKWEKEADELLGGDPPVRWHETPEQFEALYAYCKVDVDSEREVDNALPDLSDAEQQVWFDDQELNRRGLLIDIESVDGALSLIQQYVVRSNKEVEELTGGELSKVTSPLNVLRWAKEQGVDLPNFQKETVAEALKTGDIPPHVRKILQIRKQLGKTSTAKYVALKKCADEEGILKEILVYHGASTGRWSGKGFQPHNLPRGEGETNNDCIPYLKEHDLEMFELMFPNVMETISYCIRGMIIPRDGNDFIVVDWSAIEPRILFWISNEYAGLKRYELKQDLYVDMAQRVFDKVKINDKERFIGKQCILLCGYGGGGIRRPDGSDSKFMETCKKYSVEISDEISERAVNTYRFTYKAVPDMWYETERKAIEAVYTKKPVKNNKVTWVFDEKMDFLFCCLPSERRLAYHRPRIMRGKLSFMGVYKGYLYTRQTVWGGVLVENIVQALSRDILVHGMKKAADAGYPTTFHAHDELITEVKKGFGSVEYLENLIAFNPPDWAKDIPFMAKGWRGDRYEKR